MKKYDIVYILKNDVEPDEIRYSLRSIEKNFEHGKVWFYCGKPKGIQPDRYVSTPQSGITKWQKARSSLIQICKNDEITEDFWLFNDDFFILKPWENEGPLHCGMLRDLILRVEKRHGCKTTLYTQQLRNCEAALKEQGLPTFAYTLHAPMLVNRAKMLGALKAFPNCPMFRSLYGNYAELGGDYCQDNKIYKTSQSIKEDVAFVSTTEKTFTGEVKDYIRNMFPEPCKYESGPKISVIIPYKNEEPYIGKCIKSLTSQEGNFEFLFVNDHSSDWSKQVVELETDPRIIMLDNKHHTGVCGARNTGLDKATGSWITFLDADDEMLPNAYEAFCTEINKEPDADIHQFNHKRYYPTINKTVVKYANKAGRYELPKLPEVWFGVWNKLIRAEFLEGIRFDESIQYGEDGLFNLECIVKGHYIQCANPITVLHKFENKDSLSHKKTMADVLKQVNKYISFLKAHKDPALRRFLCEELARLLNNEQVKDLISNV